jgi:hypothetical protein
VYVFWCCGWWTWKRTTATLSIRILTEQFGDIDPFLEAEKYFAKNEYWDNEPTYKYIDHRLAQKPEIDTYWEDREGQAELDIYNDLDADYLMNAKPGR